MELLWGFLAPWAGALLWDLVRASQGARVLWTLLAVSAWPPHPDDVVENVLPPAHVSFTLPRPVSFPEDRPPESERPRALPGWRVDGFLMSKWDRVLNF